MYAMTGDVDPAKTAENIREALAEVAHIAWSGWTDYLFGKCEEERDVHTNRPTGRLIIPMWAIERWKRQIATPYAELTETEKNSDRAEADKMIAAIGLTNLPPHIGLIALAMLDAYNENPRGELYMTISPIKLSHMMHQNIEEVRIALSFDNDVRGKLADVANYAGFILRVYETQNKTFLTQIGDEVGRSSGDAESDRSS